MTTVSVPQVNPNDEVTAESVNAGPNAIAAVVNGQLDGANISTLPGSKLAAGSLPGTALAEEADPYLRLSESLGDFVASGLVWSALTGLNASMTTGVAYIGGKRLKPAAVPSYTFQASRDTYVFIDSTGTPQYVPVTNGATSPTAASGNLPVAIIVSNATTITSVSILSTMAGKPTKTLGWEQKSTTSVLSATYTTIGTVTASTRGGDCRARFSVRAANAGSGVIRHLYVRITLDGSSIREVYYTMPLDGANDMWCNFDMTVSSRPTAGVHQWKLEVRGSIASAIRQNDAFFEVVEA